MKVDLAHRESTKGHSKSIVLENNDKFGEKCCDYLLRDFSSVWCFSINTNTSQKHLNK